MDDCKFVEFGRRLKALREERGIQQGHLAKAVGVSRQSMSSYESGRYSPDIIVLQKMAENLGCSTDFLLGLADYPTYEAHGWADEKTARLNKALSSMPSELCKSWFNMFIRIAECISQGLAKGVNVGFETKPFYTLTLIWNLCFSAVDKQRAGEYTEKAMWAAKDNLRRDMQYIKNDLNELDDMCYQLISSLPVDNDESTNNTITHKNEG